MIRAKYKGWEVCPLSAGGVTLYVAPQLGGRIIQIEFDGVEMLFVNKSLEGCENTQSRSDWNGVWQNFGGEKVWVAPQGWDSCEQWAGPPDPVLDGGDYLCEAISESGLSLESPIDPRTGLQIGRTITLDPQSSKIEINARFTNHSPTTRRWSIWPVIQVATPLEGANRYSIVIPLSGRSSAESEYKLMHGLVNTPQVARQGNNVVVDFCYLVGKMGADSKVGWVAYCNRDMGKVMVVGFDYELGADYPDQTSVQVWTQGCGTVYSRGVVRHCADDRLSNPPYMEVELLSSLREMSSGADTDFAYTMQFATIPTQMNVVDAGHYHVCAERLSLFDAMHGVILNAHYGFFCRGRIELQIEDKKSAQIRVVASQEVSPEVAATIHAELMDGTFADADVAQVVLYNEQNELIDVLDNLRLCRI